MKHQVVGGRLRVVIQPVFPFAEIDASLAAFQAGTVGKLVVEI